MGDIDLGADLSADLSEGIDGSDVAEGKPVAGCFDGKPVILVRHGGKICALAGECTHHGAPLSDGIVIDGELRCPWHHARFSIDSGEAVGAPAFAPLDLFDIVEEDGKVRVTGKRKAVDCHQGPDRNPGHVVIIGGGAAGHACAEMLARSSVIATVLDADPAAPYDRTACSKAYLNGEGDRGDAALPNLAGMRAHAVVDRIDPAARVVVLTDGEEVGYDTLVIATGAEPVMPDFDGADGDNVFLLRTIDDAELIVSAADKADRAIVVGASFIGLEAAAALTQRGLGVTVVGADDVPLADVTGPEVGAFVRSLHEDKGVEFRLGTKVTAFDGRHATLDDGSSVAGAFLVVGTGVTPRTDLADAAKLRLAAKDVGGGIAVDGGFRTSDERIYAIGDVASVPDARLGRAIRVEHWVVAQRHGQWLARSLTGAIDGDYGDTPFFWTIQFDASLAYVGHADGIEDRTIDGSIKDGNFAVRFADDALLTCNRDKQSLRREVQLDHKRSSLPGSAFTPSQV